MGTFPGVVVACPSLNTILWIKKAVESKRLAYCQKCFCIQWTMLHNCLEWMSCGCQWCKYVKFYSCDTLPFKGAERRRLRDQTVPCRNFKSLLKLRCSSILEYTKPELCSFNFDKQITCIWWPKDLNVGRLPWGAEKSLQVLGSHVHNGIF